MRGNRPEPAGKSESRNVFGEERDEGGKEGKVANTSKVGTEGGRSEGRAGGRRAKGAAGAVVESFCCGFVFTAPAGLSSITTIVREERERREGEEESATEGGKEGEGGG